MSDMRRAARSLVETRAEQFESRHGLEESRRRLDESLARLRPWSRVEFSRRWDTAAVKPVLVAEFAPPSKTQRFLRGLSFGMALLVAATAWAFLSHEAPRTMAFLLLLITVLATIGFPFLVLGLASARAADESRIRKAIRVALLDEEPNYPPPQKWKDED